MPNNQAQTNLHRPALQTSREIYVMPCFTTLMVSDLNQSKDFYTQAAGFFVLAEIPGENSNLALIHLRRKLYQDILLVPGGHKIQAGAQIYFDAANENLEQRAALAKSLGLGEISGPLETAWYTREVRFSDPDGYQIIFTERNETEFNPEWEQTLNNSTLNTGS